MISIQNGDISQENMPRIDYLGIGHNDVASSVLNGAIVKFDYSSKRVLKDSQRIARPPRVQHFSNGMVLIERDNEAPEFISRELFDARYAIAGVN